MPPTTELYFEAHITIEPVFDQRLEQFESICRRYGFKPANLLMQKRTGDTPERSRYDTFATGRGFDYLTLKAKTLSLVVTLLHENFKVWRYKLENTLEDVRFEKNEAPAS